jgi:hypothetical protein
MMKVLPWQARNVPSDAREAGQIDCQRAELEASQREARGFPDAIPGYALKAS